MKNTLDIYEKKFQISTYIHTQWLRNNENCFSKAKVLQMKQKLIIISNFFLYYLVNEMFMLLIT